MQFVVIAYDYKQGGLERRLRVSAEHIKLGDQMKAAGTYLMGVALLDKNEQMTGSVMVMDFPSRGELDDWLENEPYVKGEFGKKLRSYL